MDGDIRIPGQAPHIDPGRNQDVPLQSAKTPSNAPQDPHECVACGVPGTPGRNLVVCLDGTKNQFGEKITNVVGLCSRIKETDTQIVYYRRGVGTSGFRKIPSPYRLLDMAFALSFDRRVLGAYEWLSANYQTGDRIFIFGFSRGAYEARTLAAMIEKVGLVGPQNSKLIPLAYRLYTNKARGRAELFKKSLSRDVGVHFLGIWDTVSSIGLARGNNNLRPGTNVVGTKTCYFRHALALDECRVKFLPEFVCGGESATECIHIEGEQPKVKEVWFIGSHSDVGGGKTDGSKFGIAAISIAWTINELSAMGLEICPPSMLWGLKDLETVKPSASIPLFYRGLEKTPLIRHLTYEDATTTTLKPHKFQGRVIKSGQKVHMSLCFIGGGYEPKATFHPDFGSVAWADIVGAGMNKAGDVSWAKDLEQYLEMDLFDISGVPGLIQRCISAEPDDDIWSTLEVMAFVRKGVHAILRNGSFVTLFQKMVRNRMERTRTVIYGLARYDITKSMVHLPGVIELIERSMYVGDVLKSDWFSNMLGDLTTNYGELPLSFLYTTRLEGHETWLKTIQSRWLQWAILATLYFARFLSSQDMSDLDRVERFLEDISESSSSKLTDAERGDLQNSLATCLEARGSIEGLRRAVEMRKSLAKSNPAKYDFDFASTRLRFYTMDLNQRHGGGPSAPASLSVRSRSEVVKENALEFASCLTNLSNRCYDLGLQDEALDNAQKSVSLFRQVLGDSTTPDNADMATALNNLSNRLSDAGKVDEALGTIEEAVRMRRSLANSDPSTYQPDLAVSLANLSRRHLRMGNAPGSLTAGKEAVAICRQLSENQPNRFDDLLSSSLHALSSAQFSMGKREAALHSIQEAVVLHQTLWKQSPLVFGSYLAGSFFTLSSHHSALEQHEEALTAARHATNLYETLSRRPTSMPLSEPGAATPTQGSSAVSRSASNDSGGAFGRGFTMENILLHLSHCYSKLNREDDASDAREKAENWGSKILMK